MDDNQKAALGILGAVAAAFTAMKMKQAKGSMYPSGSFNDDDDDEPMLPARNFVSEMVVSQRRDPFLGQNVQPYRGRMPAKPEYTLIFDLVDADLIPLPEIMQTPPERPWGPTNMAAMREHFRPDPRGIIRTQEVGYLTSKSQFYAAHALLKPMIDEDMSIITLGQMQGGGFGMRAELPERMGFDIARPQDVGNFKNYRINLMALASQSSLFRSSRTKYRIKYNKTTWDPLNLHRVPDIRLTTHSQHTKRQSNTRIHGLRDGFFSSLNSHSPPPKSQR